MRVLILLMFFLSSLSLNSQTVLSCIECSEITTRRGEVYSNFTGIEVTQPGKKTYLFQPIKSVRQNGRVILTDAFGTRVNLNASTITSHPLPSDVHNLLSNCFCKQDIPSPPPVPDPDLSVKSFSASTSDLEVFISDNVGDFTISSLSNEDDEYGLNSNTASEIAFSESGRYLLIYSGYLTSTQESTSLIKVLFKNVEIKEASSEFACVPGKPISFSRTFEFSAELDDTLYFMVSTDATSTCTGYLTYSIIKLR